MDNDKFPFHEDSLGLEDCIYKQLQNVTVYSDPCMDVHLDEPENINAFSTMEFDNLPTIGLFDHQQILSIVQSPSHCQQVPKMCKSRGRPKGSKTKTKIAAGIQTTLDDRFFVTK